MSPRRVVSHHIWSYLVIFGYGRQASDNLLKLSTAGPKNERLYFVGYVPRFPIPPPFLILLVTGYPEQPKHPFDGSQAQVKVPASVFQPHKVTILNNNSVTFNVLYQCDNLSVS